MRSTPHTAQGHKERPKASSVSYSKPQEDEVRSSKTRQGCIDAQAEPRQQRSCLTLEEKGGSADVPEAYRVSDGCNTAALRSGV